MIVDQSSRWHCQTKSKAHAYIHTVWRAQQWSRSRHVCWRPDPMFRQHLKCSLTAPRRAGTSSGFFFCFSFTQPAVWAWETWYSVVWASQSTCYRHDLQRLWYLANCQLLFIFNLSNAESRGTWKGWRTFAWMYWLSCGDTDFFKKNF